MLSFHKYIIIYLLQIQVYKTCVIPNISILSFIPSIPKNFECTFKSPTPKKYIMHEMCLINYIDLLYN